MKNPGNRMIPGFFVVGTTGLDHVGAKFALLRRFFFAYGTKKRRPPAPLLLLSAKSLARLACSVASALATARCRYQLFAVLRLRRGKRIAVLNRKYSAEDFLNVQVSPAGFSQRWASALLRFAS